MFDLELGQGSTAPEYWILLLAHYETLQPSHSLVSVVTGDHFPTPGELGTVLLLLNP